MSKLALFDFDGTITKEDTLLTFLRFTNGTVMVYLGFLLLSPALIAYKIGLIPNWVAKQMVMRYFWMGREEKWMKEQGSLFCKQKLPDLLRPEALKKLEWYKKEGWEVVVVSASSDVWISSWIEENSLTLIATKLEIENGQLSGKIDGKNCYGPEKVNRIKKQIDISKYSEIHAYGDSRGDKEMLELAEKSFFKPFRN